jgi:hypothetical protein
MIEHSKKATIIIVIVVFAVIIAIPILMHEMKFEVDEDSVWFSVEGIPHCPYCFKIVSYVEPDTGYCSRCERSFRWMDKQVVCWHCGGQKVCQTCKGTRMYPYWYVKGDSDCYDCMGRGSCRFCLPHSATDYVEGNIRLTADRDLGGYNIYGTSCIRHPSQCP